jgi:serine protease Do
VPEFINNPEGGVQMFHKFTQYISGRRFGARTIASVALSSLFVGLLVASSMHGANMSVAQGLGQHAAVTAGTPAIPGSFAELAERLGPAVVNIQVTKVAPAAGIPGMPDLEGPYGELFKRFFRDLPQRHEQFRTQGSGSGVIINQDGQILTNNHVVDGAKEVTVTLADQQTFPARVVGRDAKTDLAVLKIDPKQALPVAPMGSSADLRVGEWVLAIGNPFGLSNSVTAGIVSAKGRVIGAGPYDDFIQTDASINPGNSGGPLFNMKGEMVGINTAIIASGQGIGFAIPIDLAKPLIPQLVSTGEVTRGYLGVNIQSLTPDLAKALKLGEHQGALVADVVPGGPAAKAGIRRGDVIVGFNSEPIKSSHDLPAIVAQTPVGKEASVTLYRDGNTQKVPVTVGKLPSEKVTAEESSPASQSQWGLELQDMTPQMGRQRGMTGESGVMIVGVQPDSPAERAGLQRGDVIREVNRQPVQSVQDVRDAIAKAGSQDSLVLLVKRDQGSLFVAMAK